MIASDATVQAAAEHLSHDAVLAPVIARYGLCTIRPHHNYYHALANSIIGQQLSVKAAQAIRLRFYALFGGTELPPPQAIVAANVETLRTAGLSRAKAIYIHDLAERVGSGEIRFDHLDTLPNDEVIRELTAVKGIGEWTAHMFMMFSMGRLDVLAVGDLGVRTGIQRLYGLDHLPAAPEITQLAATHNWHPYESIACWYMWQSLDNEPKG